MHDFMNIPNRLGIEVPGGSLSREKIFQRRLKDHPHHQTSGETANEGSFIGGHFVAMRMMEDQLIYDQFNSILGLAQGLPTESREKLIESLNVEYVFFGISAGLHNTQQFVRDFEKAATEKANEVLGRRV